MFCFFLLLLSALTDMNSYNKLQQSENITQKTYTVYNEVCRQFRPEVKLRNLTLDCKYTWSAYTTQAYATRTKNYSLSLHYIHTMKYMHNLDPDRQARQKYDLSKDCIHTLKYIHNLDSDGASKTKLQSNSQWNICNVKSYLKLDGILKVENLSPDATSQYCDKLS